MKTIINALFMLLLISCISKPEENSNKIPAKSGGEILGNLIADTIIYDVLIKSTNPDDEWETQRLQYLKHSVFIDSIFNLVYNKEIIAFDIFDNKALSVSQVKSIEKQAEYSRDRIGKIQFTERWYFDPTNRELHKQILSIALGYETYNDYGELRAYKPLFKIYLN